MELAQGLLPLAAALINRANDRATISEKEDAIAELRAEYPHLLTPGKNLRSLNCAAKNIRYQLKKAFPGHDFSVTISSYSMGNSIRVAWTDGPSTSRIEAIVDRYQQGDFDGQIDLYEYRNSPWCDAFGGAKYVQTSRNFSPELRAWACEPSKDPLCHGAWDEERARWRILEALDIKHLKKDA
jgi:Large polyvalent protein associated domain 29